MIKRLLYNLPDDSDEAEFLKWRLGEHQRDNAAMPGVIRTDFARIDEQWTLANPHAPAPYRFMTTIEWADRESFEQSFYAAAPKNGRRTSRL
ncbi:MAG: hypothetical protein U0703_18455 [Anaerolineae bacterium]